MTPAEFVHKWSRNTRHERSASQEHFLDLCRLLNHSTPNDDAGGEHFAFEKGVERRRGDRSGQGWADVWKRDHFGWEYKGKHKDLDAAYKQLQQYAQSLENPPLLVVCDMETLVVHTNFNNAPPTNHTWNLNLLDQPNELQRLRYVFEEPERFRPRETTQEITLRAAKKLGDISASMYERGLEPLQVARFLDRLVFCLFAEDIGLLPSKILTQIVNANRYNAEKLARRVEMLFRAMSVGGDFDEHEIRRFNGNLFNDEPVLQLTESEIEIVREACAFNWDALNPSIMGTLFESALEKNNNRAQLGAHYTGQSDIETLVKPVVLEPLQREWTTLTARLETQSDEFAAKEVEAFLSRLREIRVLDPACGSGNFLYVALQLMKDFEKNVCLEAEDKGWGKFVLRVRPEQFIGLEVNANALDLAQTTLWIGFFQWIAANGFHFPADPLLHSTDNFHCADAILDRNANKNSESEPREAVWPQADFIVGNPPFLGGSLLWRELGRDYQRDLWRVYDGRVPGGADLCCYWFEKARAQIASGQTQRAGLIATQAIRGGVNREVLKRIKTSGDFFFALSDHDWTLKGANVHVSMIAFDNGAQTDRVLDGREVTTINADLSSDSDVTQAKRLPENENLSFIGTKKAGDFNIAESAALGLLQMPNPHGKPNSDVLRPWLNGSAIVQRPPREWIIDCGTNMSESDFSLYEEPFRHVETRVKPARDNNNRAMYRDKWWLHAETRSGMRAVVKKLTRFIATPRVSKYRIFAWCEPEVLPDDGVFIFARDDDYFFGVLHSRLHEVWALKLGTQLEDRPRYTPTSCFETFPFPLPTDEQRAAIADAARVLDERRNNWLNPPEWMREETLEFRGSVDGAWRRFVTDADANGIGTVRYSRQVPRDPNMSVPIVRGGITSAAKLRDELPRRTLTNLYNARPQWLDNAHRVLDVAVCAAYNLSPDMSDEEILASLLKLNGGANEPRA